MKNADEVIELKKLSDISSMDLNSFDASVILSHNSKKDDTYLEAVLQTSMKYI